MALIDRLQKLIAHERSTRAIGNRAEAEAFADRIQSLLAQHKLTMTEVEFEAQDKNDPISASEAILGSKRVSTWQLTLSQAIATSFYCKILTRSGGEQTSVVFIGRDSDSAAAVEMFTYLCNLGQSFAREKVTNVGNATGLQTALQTLRRDGLPKKAVDLYLRQILRKWKTDFLLGYSVALHKRLTANRQTLEATASSTATGLILRDAVAVDDFIRATFVTVNQRARRPNTLYSSAVSAGVAAGDGVSLNARTALGAGQ